MTETVVKGIVSIFLTMLTFMFGSIDMALIILVSMLILDFITGLIKAGVQKKINSSIGLLGILKKMGILCMIMLATWVDVFTTQNGVIRNTVLFFFVINEALSIMENLGEAGVPIPKMLGNLLEKLSNEEEQQ